MIVSTAAVLLSLEIEFAIIASTDDSDNHTTNTKPSKAMEDSFLRHFQSLLTTDQIGDLRLFAATLSKVCPLKIFIHYFK